MKLDQGQLDALSAAVAEGTFEAAARYLHVTPSAVSQRIKALETAVGRVLLTRTKPIRPTPSGQTLLRVARQLQTITAEAAHELGTGPPGLKAVIPVAVNADSLATWFLPALAAVGPSCAFDLRRADQDQTAEMLRDGTVMAAVTVQAEPVPGCTVQRLGRMRYRPRAAPSFAATWFPNGPTVAALAQAPVVCSDRQDQLQERYLRRRSRRRLYPPRHYVPGAADYARAIWLGLGWGMLPDLQAPPGDLLYFDPEHHVDVTLFWQRWRLRTTVLDRLSEAVQQASAGKLH
ncbi:MAG: LysR family transcriptional regulator ArgP [Streptosporangiaceae bacterium]|jgi:LysR family transcriptional regulator (chromosome initiation inhibitor)